VYAIAPNKLASFCSAGGSGFEVQRGAEWRKSATTPAASHGGLAGNLEHHQVGNVMACNVYTA
jgi:hypothetical protein